MRSIPAATEAPPDDVALRALGKAKRRLVPVVVAMYVIAYIDRANIGFAALTMNQDLKLAPEMFGFVAGIFYLGYVLFEIPSNLRLRGIGARRWLARMMVAWGALSIATIFARGVVSLSVLRFLLGAAEAGLAPGLIFYLTLWFPRRELAKVIAFYYLGVPLSAIISNPISGVILDHCEGMLGFKGWQWIFILEGLPAIVFGLTLVRFLTSRPQEADWLSADEREAYIRIMRRQEDEIEDYGHSRLKAALLDARVWTLGTAYLFIVIGLTGLGFWMPQIIKEFQISNTLVGMVSIIPFVVGAAAMFLWTSHSDSSLERYWHFIAPSVLFSLGFVVTATARLHSVSMLGMTLSMIGALSAVPVFYTLPASFLTGDAAAGGIALINSIGNIGGFIGPYAVGLLTRSSGGSVRGLGALAVLVMVAPLLVWVAGNPSGRISPDRP